MSSAVDVICPSGRRRARAKHGGLLFRSLCFQIVASFFVLASASSGNWLSSVQGTSDQYRRPEELGRNKPRLAPWQGLRETMH